VLISVFWFTPAILTVASALVINEVCYDPPGADAGGEYVEIINPGPQVVSLAGCRLEFANGAVGLPWVERWHGDESTSLAAGDVYLIVDTGWTGPPPHAVVNLDLQNGPDAIRLVCPDETTDVVGWGNLEWPDLYEGTPATDVANGVLARRPDGQDSQDNAQDFRVAEPSPGERNWANFAPRLTEVRWEPPSLVHPADDLAVQLTVMNDGLDDCSGAGVELTLGGASVSALLPALPPESSCELILEVTPTMTGLAAAWLRFHGEAALDTLTFAVPAVQIGVPDVRLTEVMAAPGQGGEWCEIHNTGTVPRSLGALALRDEDGAWCSLPDVLLAPGDCRLVAQDSTALAEWLAQLAAAGTASLCQPVEPVACPGWPSLNNTAPEGRSHADRLHLGSSDGTVLDHVTLGQGSGRAPESRSLERQPDLDWRPATARAGATPGCLLPIDEVADPGEIKVEPNPFSPGQGAGALRIGLHVPDRAVGWELRIYDLWGRLQRDLGGDDLGPGPRNLAWDGCNEQGTVLPMGGYVVVVRWRAAGGATAGTGRRLVVIREEAP